MEPTTNGSLAAKASYLDPTRKLHETLVENYLKELPKNASKFADAQFVSPSPARLSANMFPISELHSLLFAVGITISLNCKEVTSIKWQRQDKLLIFDTVDLPLRYPSRNSTT